MVAGNRARDRDGLLLSARAHHGGFGVGNVKPGALYVALGNRAGHGHDHRQVTPQGIGRIQTMADQRGLHPAFAIGDARAGAAELGHTAMYIHTAAARGFVANPGQEGIGVGGVKVGAQDAQQAGARLVLSLKALADDGQPARRFGGCGLGDANRVARRIGVRHGQPHGQHGIEALKLIAAVGQQVDERGVGQGTEVNPYRRAAHGVKFFYRLDRGQAGRFDHTHADGAVDRRIGPAIDHLCAANGERVAPGVGLMLQVRSRIVGRPPGLRQFQPRCG